MDYAIRHLTQFRYSVPISESVMETRMQPRSEGMQRCLSFDISVTPRAPVRSYRDYLGNAVHHFGIPGYHSQLAITVDALVEMTPPPPLPAALAGEAWRELDVLVAQGDHWDTLAPSYFARPTALLEDLAQELRLKRQEDPLTVLRALNTAMYDTFTYVPESTKVDSPIDAALGDRQGVCQDFAHIMIALVRQLGIPCRYVSGYLFHRREDHDRSEEDATHAWLEALLPGLGWVGFDPTNNLIAGDRHIRVAIGRDYADVPPTQGVFRGSADSELSVAVQVTPAAAPEPQEMAPVKIVRRLPERSQQEQQQQ